MSKEDSDDEYYTAMLKVRGAWYHYRAPSDRDIGAISDKDFVVAWQRSDTLGQVSRILGVKVRSVIDRAADLRKNGVALKSL